ncbi:indolepyruvate ferredoxin oxidoreductase family protein [Streptomyces sp. NPDC052023]|uniref:indolepyruvate ferredoxin oxidoreductase family protein n=1 Tax=Streptomyces sp. NPDC052023 TaxID=3365681 RepID=UPI0037D67B51
MTSTIPSRNVSLQDRFTRPEGRVHLSGVQALVRLILDQRTADERNGLRTAALVSGYQGSPLGTFDTEFARQRALADRHGIVLRPGVNEELAATAVWGSQLTDRLPGSRYDGVLGVWYGKSPGVDRASDAIRHGNHIGTSPTGGVLALTGDDPTCKSSSIPGASESLLAALQVPVLYPGNVQEILDLGRHAVACSRASGLWAALKVVTKVADSNGTADVGLDWAEPRIPTREWEGTAYRHVPTSYFAGLAQERTLDLRLELARDYARLNRLNTITQNPPGAKLGVIAGGTAYHDLRQAIGDLGITELPLRILKIGMLYPLEQDTVREFAKGLDEVLVLEDKGPFLERLVKDALYGISAPPVVTGKRDATGAELLPASGALEVESITRGLGARVLAHHDHGGVRDRLGRLDRVAGRSLPLIMQRTPHFCSGCPHNLSTRAPDDTLVGAGIGCHVMVLANPEGRGNITGATQMGGEGAQWIGIEPFLENRHFLQNIGDGTFHHSGSMAIRAAVAAGVNITYKLLYNDAVAMTGGQQIEGRLSVPELTRMLEAEGVRKIVITAEDPRRYRGVRLARIAEVRPRLELERTQAELAEIPGVTVLIHDQLCAIEKRRARKRGTLPDPPQRVLISERVCEGCGDCGEKSNCLSVEPVPTEFGRKTRIHQGSCNKDFTCLEGDCPPFLTVVPPPSAAEARPGAPELPDTDLPDPTPCVPADDVRIRMVGVGGTGVVTVNQVLAVAAMIDGRHTSGLDQTGLAQKGGPVVSDVRISTRPLEGGVTAPQTSAHVLLGFDLLGAAAAHNLAVADPDRTVAVVCSDITPTGRMATDVSTAAPDAGAALAAVDSATRRKLNVHCRARALAEALFGDHMPANVIMLGAAWQRGAIPVSLDALREAFELNAVAVEQNLAAFAWGRACVAAPDQVEDRLRRAARSAPRRPGPRERELIDGVTADEGELRRLLEIRVPDLVAYQNLGRARRYTEAIAAVLSAESERIPGSTKVTEAVATYLYKLMAYKDEYEVARLQLETLASLPRGTRAAIHLQPPVLRALGMKRKIRLGGWFTPVLHLLRGGRRLRGTRFDPFGYTVVRRTERALPEEYLEHVGAALTVLGPENLATVVELCETPDLVRGYEHIKLAGVDRFRGRAAELRDALRETAA